MCAGTLACEAKVTPVNTGAGSATTASPTSPKSPKSKGRIIGIVRWTGDDAPAAGVMVLAQGRDSADMPESTANIYEFTRTDQSGRYEVEGLPPGEYQLEAFANPRLPERCHFRGPMADL